MARSYQSRHAARHASAARRTPLADLGRVLTAPLARPGSTIAKVTSVSAAGGLAVALALPGGAAVANASDTMSVESASTDLATSLLDQRSDQVVSRASARAAVAPVAALQAPVAAAPVTAPAFGTMSFTAVEKPPPPPEPEPQPAAPASTGSAPSAGSGGSGGSGSGSAPQSQGGAGFDWAAANACSCARGLTQNSMRVLAAVKYSFPGMTNIGGVRPDSMPDHPSGRALDFMTTDKGYGDAIANMLISRSGELNIEYIIWRQRVWLPSSGWRTMADRGSATANHYDHVHVTVR